MLVAVLAVLAPTAALAEDLPRYSGPEFNALFTDADLPGLEPIGSLPSITGNSSVDARIRRLAEARGYRVRPVISRPLTTVEGHQLQPEAAEAWRELKAAARTAGHTIQIRSAYRSVATQRGSFTRRMGGTSDAGIEQALRWAAPPGYSKHQTGYAVDVMTPGSANAGFGGTAAYRWLAADNYANAKRHGFIPSYPPDGGKQGPEPEPWEFVWVGTEVIRCGADLSGCEPPGPVRPDVWRGTYWDDDASVFENDIEMLTGFRVLRGCNPPDNDMICVDDPVTRGEAAAILRRALAWPAGDVAFDDVAASHVFAGDLAAAGSSGVIRGCNPPDNTLACPDDQLTRGQMAAILVRGFGFEPGDSVGFDDVAADDVFAADIAAIGAVGVTRGCDPPDNTRFCPADPVTRGQLAAFVVRALQLT